MSRLMVIVLALVGMSVVAAYLPTRSQSQEKGAPVKPIATAKPSEQTLESFRVLDQSIDTKGLQEKVKLKEALEYLSGQVGDKLPILIDREAFALELGADAPDPYEEEVELPSIPRKMTMGLALRLLTIQVGKGRATYVVRKNFVVITTRQFASAPYLLQQTMPLLTFDQRPLTEVLGAFAEENSVAINIDPAVGKNGVTPISATFRHCSLEEALVTVTEIAELKFVVLEHSVYVTTPEKAIVLRKEEEKRAEDRKELRVQRGLAPGF